MSIGYKWQRIRRWSKRLGWWQSLRFEFLWTLRRPTISVSVPGYDRHMVLRRSTSDISVFETVFIDRELEDHLPTEPKLIIDGGANVGFSTAFYARTFPSARVVAVEPSDENAKMLRRNCAGFSNVQLVHGGLWSHSGYLAIENPQDAAWAFRCVPSDAHAPGAFPAYSLGDVIGKSGIDHCDLLKLDVEGAEEQLFAGAADWLGRVSTILVEVHGAKALRTIDEACSGPEWARQECGEKLLLTRKAVQRIETPCI